MAGRDDKVTVEVDAEMVERARTELVWTVRAMRPSSSERSTPT